MLLIGSPQQLHATASGNVIEPEFSSAKRPTGREVLSTNNKSSVWRKGRVIEKPKFLFCDRPATVVSQLLQPYVVSPFTITYESDGASIG